MLDSHAWPQDWLNNFMRNNISMNPSLHTRVYRDKGAPEVEGVVEPICAAVQDSICVKWCRPAYARLQPDQRSYRVVPARDDRGKKQGKGGRLRGGHPPSFPQRQMAAAHRL